MTNVTEELLTMLQQCANKLLLAYDDTLRPDVWAAFEKTADACSALALNLRPNTTIH
ncbi:hypothetical protein J2N86_15565 (plasmid) [Legionella lytica]|uniref:Uncharacterized protein n=1 Tax=Legionella lytica TaxID=96232 RepID=A0ABY4YD80_9GAMM|nr:hypothetical protein [Legionella lytica]USQ15564.1 hypothetical protein J2N86_15565 [Legionella lytica]